MPSISQVLARVGASAAIAFIAATTCVVAPMAASAAAPMSSQAASTSVDPPLAVMNADGDHAMGSTIPASDAASLSAAPAAASRLQMAATTPTATPGMDVSAYQGNVNWSSAYSNGARFAYVKATEGTTYTSAYFSQQYNGSYNAGMIRGAYVFATPNTTTGAAQAKYFVAHGGGWSADGRTLPPLLDIEYGYNATCWGLSQTSMVAWIRDFTTAMKSLTGISPAIYSTADWWTQCTGNTSAFSADPLFIAHYTTATTPGTLPAGWGNWTFWQHADSGVFPGDEDYFNGATASLKTVALAGKTTTTPPAPTTNTSPPVTPKVGTTLPEGSSVSSSNGQYETTMQSDGNFVLYDNGRALWSTATSGNPGAHFIAQADGNAVVYSAAGKALWNSHTAGKGTAPELKVSDAGETDLVSTAGTTWREVPAGTEELTAGTTLKAGGYLHTATGGTVLDMQADGNLVIYVNGHAAWSSKTSGNPGATATLQSDGNFVVYSPAGRALWNTRTNGVGAGVRLVLQSDGNLVLYKSSHAVWSTHTHL